jgi:hypothetical protein
MRKCSRKQEINTELKRQNEKKNKPNFIKFTYFGSHVRTITKTFRNTNTKPEHILNNTIQKKSATKEDVVDKKETIEYINLCRI